jgi:hypothetical protein
MAQLASVGIYVIADLGEPSTSIESNNPEWDVELYQRYTGVVDALSKYRNVIGFFAGNENVSQGNQTSAAAFVKAAVRDTKQYIANQNYRKTLGVGYATADVPVRDQLASYFACQPGDQGNKTAIDFWGYNVYSWCGDSNYQTSSYGERVDFFRNYPVPVFFAEYGCIEGIQGGPTNRPFTEVEVLYGNMTSVFSGGIVYEWFMGANNYGLVSLVNSATVSPYPDFTSLSSQLAKVSPTITQRSAYTPASSAPACPSVGGSWLAQASPLPPTVNPQLCACMADSLQCGIKSNDEPGYAAIFNYICDAKASFCAGINSNATTGSYGAYAGCNPKEKLAFAANQYYLGNSRSASACSFSGAAAVRSANTASACTPLLSAAGAQGSGSVPTATGKGTASVGGGGGGGGGAKASSSSGGSAGSVYSPGFFKHGSEVMGVWVVLAVGSLLGMLAL